LTLLPLDPRLAPLRQAQGRLWAVFFRRPSTSLRAGFCGCICLAGDCQQEFGGDQIFEGAAYAFEYGDILRAASSLLFSAD